MNAILGAVLVGMAVMLITLIAFYFAEGGDEMKRVLMKLLLSEAGYALWDSLSDPYAWEIEAYKIIHKNSKLTFWTANGRFFLDGYDNTPSCLGWIERHLIWPRVNGLRNKDIAVRFTGVV